MGRIQEIGDRLFQVFQDGMAINPGPGLRQRSAAEWQRQADASLEKLYAAAREERMRHRLGVIGRARVAFHLQRRMAEAGHPPELVRQVLFALLVAAFSSNPR